MAILLIVLFVLFFFLPLVYLLSPPFSSAGKEQENPFTLIALDYFPVMLSFLLLGKHILQSFTVR